MKTYDKIEQVKERIIDVELLKIAKTKNKYFTRERKIKFSTFNRHETYKLW